MTLRSIMADAAAGMLAREPGNFWLPPRASTVAGEVDFVFWFIFGIAAFFFALIVFLMVWFVVRYRRRPGHQPQKTATHNLTLELTWSIIPTILVVVIFWMGFRVYMNQRIPPAGGIDVDVYAKKWNWEFDYRNGVKEPQLHVPRDVPVRLRMISEDVIHSLYVPAFRIKMDLIPQRYTTAWFEATQAGEFDLYCAEYCGTGHSDMITKVIVHNSREDFEKWMEEAAKWMDAKTPVEAGKELVLKRKGCVQCHSVDGRGNTGPTFKGLYGHEVKFVDGSSAVADDDYIRESILEPQARVVAGFGPVSAMNSYAGSIKEEEITAIIEYLKTLADNGEAGAP